MVSEMKRYLIILLYCCALYAQDRPPKEPASQGQTALTPRFHKDETAFKAIAKPSEAMKQDEFNLRMCYGVSGMTIVNSFYAKYNQLGCSAYFKVLEDDLAKSGR